MIKLNEKLEDFSAESTKGEFSFSEYSGKVLVLYFYPRDNTSGCTAESQDFAKNYKRFNQHNAEVVGISRDTLKSHHKFMEKYGFPFPLLADPKEKICNMFGVMKDKNMYGKKVRGIERSTFIFDAAGVLVHEWRKVKIPGHVDEVLAKVADISAKGEAR